MGAKRADEAFVYLSQVAYALGTNPAGAARKLKGKGLEPQTLIGPDGKPRKVYQRLAVTTHVDGVGDLEDANISDEFVGTSKAAEILGQNSATNASRTLVRRGVEPQFLDIGIRQVRVYGRKPVEQVGKELAKER